MSMLTVIKMSIKRRFRDKNAVVMMLLLPIMFILVYGIMFGKINDNSINIKSLNIGVVSNNNEIEKNYIDFLNTIKKEKGFEKLTVSKIDDIEEGKKKIKSSNLELLVKIDGKNVIIFKGEGIATIIAENITNSYMEKISIISLASSNKSEIINEIIKSVNKNYVEYSSINKTEQMSSMNYYGVTMVIFAILYGGIYGASATKHLREAKGRRMLISPTSKWKIFLGEFLSVVFFIIIQVVLVMVFAGTVYKVDYGTSPMILLPILFACFISVSIGMFAGSIFKVEAVAQGIVSGIAVVLSILSGLFFQASEGSMLDKISTFSPIKHITTSIFNIISGSSNGVVFACITSAIITSILLTVTRLIYEKEGI